MALPTPLPQVTAPPSPLAGVLAPVLTPFQRDLAPDPERFSRHCHWLLQHGCSGLAVFGTNSEANSLAVEERMALLEALIQGGVPAAKLLPGTGCCALPDSVKLTAHAVRLGCAGVLMLPPFYYKAVTDEGLFRWFSEVIQRVGDARLRLYLYHIPPVAQVPITLGLIERLLKAYPQQVAGLKDSSGDWNHTQAVLEAFAPARFEVFAGSEVFLLQNLRAGGVGCISAAANVNPHGIHAIYRQWQSAEAQVLQTQANSVRNVLQSVPMIPALKAVLAHYSDDAAWATVRPPLVELSSPDCDRMFAGLVGLGFGMPGLRS